MKIKTKITGKEFYEIRKSVNWKDVNIEQLDKALENSMVVVGIYEENELIAMGRLVGDYCFKALLSDIIVKPNYQRKGYGQIVISKLLEITKENMKNAHVDVKMVMNVNARKIAHAIVIVMKHLNVNVIKTMNKNKNISENLMFFICR